jgi:sirohydrochlorin ferrochelatase
MNSPILIACAHGTSSAQGAAEVNALRDAIAALRPGLDVREAYVDVQQPDLVDVVAGLPDDPAPLQRATAVLPPAGRAPPVPPPSSCPCCSVWATT